MKDKLILTIIKQGELERTGEIPLYDLKVIEELHGEQAAKDALWEMLAKCRGFREVLKTSPPRCRG